MVNGVNVIVVVLGTLSVNARVNVVVVVQAKCYEFPGNTCAISH